MNDSRKYWYTGTAAIFALSLIPLLIPRVDTWDFAITEMGFLRHDYDYFETFRICFHVRYLILVVLEKLSLLGISPKVVMNVLSVFCLAGISRQVFVFFRERYHFSWETSLVGAWAILAFPVWHTVISGAVFSYILFFFFFMYAVNLWRRKRYLPAGILFVISLNLYSLFAFAVGFAVSGFILDADKDNYKKKALQVFLFSALLLAGYILLNALVNIHELGGEYNRINLERFDSFAWYFLATPLVLAFACFIRKKFPEDDFKKTFIRYTLSLLTLGLFSVFAYWAVGHNMRFFNFGSYTSRHTYLTCIPFALLVALGREVVIRLWSKKAANAIVGVLMVALIVLLHQGYSHKAAALIYRDVIAQEIAKQSEPPSGYVAIVLVNKEAPRHIHYAGLARALHKAFGKTAWMLNDPWQRSITPTPENMKKLYEKSRGRKESLSDQVTGDAYTRYELHLDGYHQEGRFWYWWYYLTENYSAFSPRLVIVQQIPSLGEALP